MRWPLRKRRSMTLCANAGHTLLCQAHTIPNEAVWSEKNSNLGSYKRLMGSNCSPYHVSQRRKNNADKHFNDCYEPHYRRYMWSWEVLRTTIKEWNSQHFSNVVHIMWAIGAMLNQLIVFGRPTLRQREQKFSTTQIRYIGKPSLELLNTVPEHGCRSIL